MNAGEYWQRIAGDLPSAGRIEAPAIGEPLLRLVHSDLGLAELFVRQAEKAGMSAQALYVDELIGCVTAWLRRSGFQRVAYCESALLEKLELNAALEREGFRLVPWHPNPKEPFDCLLADAAAAIAETGSVVFRHAVAVEEAASCIVILQPRDFVGDVLDWCERLPEASGQDLMLVGEASNLQVFVLK